MSADVRSSISPGERAAERRAVRDAHWEEIREWVARLQHPDRGYSLSDASVATVLRHAEFMIGQHDKRGQA